MALSLWHTNRITPQRISRLLSNTIAATWANMGGRKQAHRMLRTVHFRMSRSPSSNRTRKHPHPRRRRSVASRQYRYQHHRHHLMPTPAILILMTSSSPDHHPWHDCHENNKVINHSARSFAAKAFRDTVLFQCCSDSPSVRQSTGWATGL